MKPFNIDAAKRGEKVVARDGRPARIICFDAKGPAPIISLIDNGMSEYPRPHYPDGSYVTYYDESDKNDLFMYEPGPQPVFDRQVLDSVDKNRLVPLPFDLQSAKAGAALITRDGRFASLMKSDCKGDLPLVVIVEDNGDELACNYTESGRIYDDEKESGNSNCDLFMVGLTENNY